MHAAVSIEDIITDTPTLLPIIEPHVTSRRWLKVHERKPYIEEVVRYDPLERKSHEGHLNYYKSYPGMARIIGEARCIIKTSQTTWIEELINLMKGHESQQSAPLLASIDILISKIIKTKQLQLSHYPSEILADIILWKVEVIKCEATLPVRKFCLVDNFLPT